MTQDDIKMSDIKCILDTTKSKLYIGNILLPNDIIEHIYGLKLNVKPEIYVYGRKVHQRRDVGFYSDISIGYQYSGQLSKSIPLTKELSLLLNYINTKFNDNFNGILINKYNNGEDYISAHSDDERNLGERGVISITLGASRKFRIRDKHTKEKRLDIITSNGTLLHMSGNFQKEFTHEIPIEKRIKHTRISLTFRKHLK